jgi:hypothetical protein
MVHAIARACAEDADTLSGKSPKAPSGFLGLLGVVDPGLWATPRVAPLVPPDELLFYGYSLQRAQSYLREAEEYLEQAQAWARTLSSLRCRTGRLSWMRLGEAQGMSCGKKHAILRRIRVEVLGR